MDKDLEKIIKNAGKSTSTKKGLEAKPYFQVPSKPYDYLVYKKLTAFSGFSVIPFIFIFPLAMCIGFVFPGFAQVTILSLVSYAGLLILYVLINLLRFQLFKGWQEKLPFALKGWNEMIAAKKMYCDLCWNDTQITVEHNAANKETVEVIQAALTLFCKRTQKAFYQQEITSSGSQLRQEWKLVNPSTAIGSANPEVMRYMKNLFEKELSLIANKTKQITAVNIEFLSEEFEIKIERNTGD